MDDTDLIDLIVGDGSPSDIHSKIKELITQKATQSIDDITPYVTASMFGAEIPDPEESEEESETEDQEEMQGDDEEYSEEDQEVEPEEN